MFVVNGKSQVVVYQVGLEDRGLGFVLAYLDLLILGGLGVEDRGLEIGW